MRLVLLSCKQEGKAYQMIQGKEAQSERSEIESVIFHFKWMMLAIYSILQVDEVERNENNLGNVI